MQAIVESSRALDVPNIVILVTAAYTQTLSQCIISLTLVCQGKHHLFDPPSAEQSPQVVFLSSSQ